MAQQLWSACLIVTILSAGSAKAEPPAVVVSIAPIHSLVASVMEGIAKPDLLVPGNVSDHEYAMRPSDMRKVAGADLVVWIGEPLEAWLEKPLETERVPALELIEAAGIDPHPYAGAGEKAAREEHERADQTHEGAGAEAGGGDARGHDHLGLDPHVWLDPVRAQAIVRAVAERLAGLDAENAHAYRANADAKVADLAALDADIRGRLAPFSGEPFATFHDGYSYFVERYGLNQVGQLTVDPDRRPGAATVGALRERVNADGIACVFAEPQFDRGALEAMAGEGTVKVGVLDAIGAGIEPGPALYDALLRANAQAVETCLAPTS